MRLLLSASVLVATACTLPAWSQTAAPAVPATAEPQPEAEVRPPPDEPPGPAAAPTYDRLLEIELLELQLGFEASYDQRSVTAQRRRAFGTRTERQNNRSRSFEETLGVATRGALLDERFALFDIAVRGGLSQDYFAETGRWPARRDHDDGGLFEYDLNLTLFPRGKVSATAYAQRLDSRVPRAFQPSLDRTRERYGTVLTLNDRVVSMRFSFEHEWEELRSRTGSPYDDEQRGRDTFRYEATWNLDRNQQLEFRYEYDDRSERYAGTRTRFDTYRHYLTLNHLLRFGRDNRSSWENLLRLQDESGDLSRDTAEASSRLRLQWTDQFSTDFRAQWLRDAFQDLEAETWRGEVGAAYRFSEALTASAQLYGLQQQQNANADLSEWGAVADLSYSQKNDWGRFSANVSYNHASIQTRNGDRRGIVIAEAVSMRDPQASYLAKQNVDHFSLVVTDASRTRTYLRGRDYVALRIGRFTALRRLATGAIADRETVLVSYVYEVYRDYALDRDRFDVRIQQAFDFGLTPYYAGSLQEERITERGFLRYEPRDVNRHRLGATYRRSGWSAGFEYEYNDDSIDPYQALHANGDVVLWARGQNQLDGKTTFSHFWYDGTRYLDARDALLLDVGLNYRHLLTQQLEASVATLYRFEDDSFYGVTHGVDVTAGMEWRIGYFTLLFEAEYDMLDLPGSRDNTMAFWLKLRRDFPIIAKKAAR
ncbi:MAG: hypothetical protein IPM18_16015 [Phycisphaerales bacterium]|nr:hypothetical protein [Phycisphaerales bacterium]